MEWYNGDRVNDYGFVPYERDFWEKASSRSITDLSSLIRIVVRKGNASVGTECAVTRAAWQKSRKT